MLEEQIIDYLHVQTGLHVSNEKNAARRYAEYILIQRTGGGVENFINNATYAIQSISSHSKLRAAQINEMVKQVMEAFADEEGISSCKLNSDYDYTNTLTKEYRYQAVFGIVYF